MRLFERVDRGSFFSQEENLRIDISYLDLFERMESLNLRYEELWDDRGTI